MRDMFKELYEEMVKEAKEEVDILSGVNKEGYVIKTNQGFICENKQKQLCLIGDLIKARLFESKDEAKALAETLSEYIEEFSYTIPTFDEAKKKLLLQAKSRASMITGKSKKIK
jgi:hypothetical protein